MGIACQSSCYLVPDFYVKDSKKGKLKKTTRRKLMKRRKEQMDSVLEEARLWASAMLLPLHLISEKPELYRTMRDLTIRLLGPNVREDKINCVFRKLSQHVLLPDIEETSDVSNYPTLTDEQLLHISDEHPIIASMLYEIYDQCPNFEAANPNARTWADVKRCADSHTIYDQPLKDWVVGYQIKSARANLGLPNNGRWTSDVLKKVKTRLLSPNPLKLENASDLCLVAHNCNLIQASFEPRPGDFTASQSRSDNVMTLHPPFFEEMEASIKEPGVIIHELFHAPSVLFTIDQDFEYSDHDMQEWTDDYLCIKFMDEDELKENPDGPHRYTGQRDLYSLNGNELRMTSVTAYGIQACIDLVMEGRRSNMELAEDNAESWALLNLFRVLIFAYPDFDFFADRDEGWGWNARPRETLLHHCSLFDFLRNPETQPYKSITDHPGYDPSKDLWAKGSGRKRPESMKELLETVDEIVKERLRQEDEKARLSRET
ncbi:hypothetical protein PMZ80_008118 [Knufia obscura]|uniref:Uncharacterized protein n=1 Tax=Knufia obscura TaxID=1635080 RepID=A0ABR0RGI1_9EURO|nr:hypothetical protein PMZ80_008118 [Knufia obscura]